MAKTLNDLGINEAPKVTISEEEKEEFSLIFEILSTGVKFVQSNIISKRNLIPRNQIKTLEQNKTAILVSNPERQIPLQSKIAGTYFQNAQDNNLIEYLLSQFNTQTLKLNTKNIRQIITWGTSKQKNILNKSKTFINCLPLENDTNFWETLNEGSILHSNSDTNPKLFNDLYNNYQILEQIGAKQPKTIFLTLQEIGNIPDITRHPGYRDFIIKQIESPDLKGEQSKLEEKEYRPEQIGEYFYKKYKDIWDFEFSAIPLKDFIDRKTKESGLKINKNNKVMLRTGKSSFKYMDPDKTYQNETLQKITKSIRLAKLSFQNEVAKKVEKTIKDKNIGEAVHGQKEAIRLIQSMKDDKSIQKIFEDAQKWEKVEKMLIDGISGHSLKKGFQKVHTDCVFENSGDIASWFLQNFYHILGNNLLTDSGIAMREYINIGGQIDREDLNIPFGKEYRCIVNNGEVISIDFWTPLRDIKDELENKTINLEDYQLSEKHINEIKRVAKEFSIKTDYKSFTLDTIVSKKSELYFLEMNRLEFSSMSHQKTRMILAYESACYLASIEPNEKDFQDFFHEVTLDFPTFDRVFYKNLHDFWSGFLGKHPEMQKCYDTWKKVIHDEYEVIKKYDIVWGKYKTGVDF